MVLAVNGGCVYLERRPAAGIWGGLWSLPEVDDVDDWCRSVFDAVPVTSETQATLRHSFSHYDLDIRPVVVRIDAVSRRVADNPDAAWHRVGAAPPGGIAAPVQKLINTLQTIEHGANS